MSSSPGLIDRAIAGYVSFLIKKINSYINLDAITLAKLWFLSLQVWKKQTGRRLAPNGLFTKQTEYRNIYTMSGVANYKDLLDKLYKFKISSGLCVYINKLEDINLETLKQLISTSVADMKDRYKID